MTRNEFIAETAAKMMAMPCDGAWSDSVPEWCSLRGVQLADALEKNNTAPWLTPPAPALTDAARRVVEAAVEWNAAYESTDDNHALRTRVALSDAVNAYKESAK